MCWFLFSVYRWRLLDGWYIRIKAKAYTCENTLFIRDAEHLWSSDEIEWERISKGGTGYGIFRLKVPEGWLVYSSCPVHGRPGGFITVVTGNASLVFIADENHKWDCTLIEP